MKRSHTLAALRRAITLACGPALKVSLDRVESPEVRVGLIERLARAHQMLDDSSEQRVGSGWAAGGQRPLAGEGLRSREGASSGSSRKPARAVSLREGGVGETPTPAAPGDGCAADLLPTGSGPAAGRQRSVRKPQPYDADATFLAFAASFPQGRRSGLPAAYRLWGRLSEIDRADAAKAIVQEVAEAHTSGKPDAAGFVRNIVKWLEGRPWEGRRLPAPVVPEDRYAQWAREQLAPKGGV